MMIGKITMNAAPKNDPMIDPSPPMITMNNIGNDALRMLNTSGSAEP